MNMTILIEMKKGITKDKNALSPSPKVSVIKETHFIRVVSLY